MSKRKSRRNRAERRKPASIHTSPQAADEPGEPRWLLPVIAAVLIAATVAVYLNSFQGRFLLDDYRSIVRDERIRTLSPVGRLLVNSFRNMRPTVNLSLALNWAISEKDVWSYHLFNLLVHVGSAVTLFGVARRTLRTPRLAPHFGRHATWLAGATALLWAVHPLHTAAVTYVIQRCESMMGLFYLLTVYSFLRAEEARRPWAWSVGAVAAMLVGMGCKQVIATAPLVLAVFDVVLLRPSPAVLRRRRLPLYAALCATWLTQLALLSRSMREAGAGFALRGMPWQKYMLTQLSVVGHYLALAFWPARLCLDYRSWEPAGFLGAALPAIVTVALLGGTILALARRRPIAVLGAWFFLILAPSSSFMPLADIAFEHRMYLSLAAVAAGVVLGAYRLAGALGRRARRVGMRPAIAAGMAILLLACSGALGWRTWRRNQLYEDEAAMWRDVLRRCPRNPRAWNALGSLLALEKKYNEAMHHHLKALELAPGMTTAKLNLANAYLHQRSYPEARDLYEQVIVALAKKAFAEPALRANAHDGLAGALLGLDDLTGAEKNVRLALKLNPNAANSHCNLGLLLMRIGRRDEAVLHLRKAIDLDPSYLVAREHLMSVWMSRGNHRAAVETCRDILRHRPDHVNALNNLAWLLATSADADVRNGPEAVAHATRLVELTAGAEPVFLDTLAAAYAETGRFEEAGATARKALDIARQANRKKLLGELEERLRLFEAGKPFRRANEPGAAVSSPASRPGVDAEAPAVPAAWLGGPADHRRRVALLTARHHRDIVMGFPLARVAELADAPA